METEDPRAAIQDKSVAVRSAGCRDLARAGGWDDVEPLVRLGWTDPSPAVRLYAAAAAADLVGRRRGAHGQTPLTPAEAAAVRGWAFGGDPGACPSMLMLAAPLTGDDVLRRLGRILRDPRVDVRLGAITALRRMALSAAADVARIEAALATWLADVRTPADTRADLVRLVGEAGFGALETKVIALRGEAEGFAEACDEALDRLAQRRDDAAWTGLWRSDGWDVFELPAEGVDRAPALAAVVGEAWIDASGTHGRDAAPIRQVWARPLGAKAARRALQRDGRTWWVLEASEITAGLDTLWTDLRDLGPEAIAGVRPGLDLGKGAGAERVDVVLRWLAGDAEGALASLDTALDRSRPRHDLWFWRSQVRASQGDDAGAAADARTYLDKAGKRAVHRAIAEAIAGPAPA